MFYVLSCFDRSGRISGGQCYGARAHDHFLKKSSQQAPSFSGFGLEEMAFKKKKDAVVSTEEPVYLHFIASSCVKSSAASAEAR